MARILVIDDNASVAQSLGYFLEASGYEAVVATSGRAGLQCASEKGIDLVLLDIEMPDMSGFMVCRAILEDPGLRHLPVVMMTGSHLQQAVLPARAAGARTVMGKPFDLEELQRTLNHCLGLA